MPVPPDEVARILAALGFAAADAPGPAWRVTVPGWRPDVARPEDLIEEVGRHHGFEHLPATFPPVLQPPAPSDRAHRPRRARPAHAAGGRILRVDHLRVHRRDGGRAVRRRDAAGPPGQSAVGDLRGDAAQPAARAGRARSATTAATSSATCSCSRSPPRSRRDGERRSLGAAWTGAAGGDHWSGHRRDVDFFDVTGLAEAVLAGFGAGADLRAGRHRLAGRRTRRPGRRRRRAGGHRRAAGAGHRRRARRAARRRRLRGRARPRSAHRAGAARLDPRRADAALPVDRARRVAARARHLVCRHRS